MLAPVLVTAPAETPITLAQVKANARIDTSADDTMATALIDAATAHLDGWAGILGRALVTQTWRQDFSRFSSRLSLSLAPVASITSLTYYDSDNTSQTLASSVYELRTDELGPHVRLKPDQSWPGTYSRVDAVSVTFVAGYGAAADVPQAIKQALLLMVGHWYEHRESVGPVQMHELPMAAHALLAPYRRIGF